MTVRIVVEMTERDAMNLMGSTQPSTVVMRFHELVRQGIYDMKAYPERTSVEYGGKKEHAEGGIITGPYLTDER